MGEDVGLGTGQGAHPGVRVGAAALARRGPFRRYTVGAWLFDALSLEWPVYDAGRVAGISALLLRPGALVLDIGCGTGLNFPLLREPSGAPAASSVSMPARR